MTWAYRVVGEAEEEGVREEEGRGEGALEAALLRRILVARGVPVPHGREGKGSEEETAVREAHGTFVLPKRRLCAEETIERGASVGTCTVPTARGVADQREL